MKNFVLFGLFVSICPQIYKFYHNYNLPIYDQAEPFYHLENLWTEQELTNLRGLVKKIGKFHTAAQDRTSNNKFLEIRQRKNPDGTCPHLLLVPDNFDPSLCVLPGRVDMFKHYALTGGKYGAKVKLLHFSEKVSAFRTH